MNKLLQNKALISLGVVLLGLLLGYRIFMVVHLYAPTLIVMDKWHTLDPLFYNYNWWEGFSLQHGPHRLGIIYFLFKVDAFIGNWNNQTDMYVQAAVYVLTALLALRLKLKLIGPIHWSDTLIPLIFLTPHAGVTLTNNPFVHGLVPLFALSLCFIYLIKSERLQLFWLCIFSLLAAFSGFSLVCIPALLILEGIRFIRSKKKTFPQGMPAMLGAMSLLFILLTNVPKTSSALHAFSPGTGIKYALALMGNLFLIQPKDSALIGVALLLTGVAGLGVYFILRKRTSFSDPVNVSIFLLLTSTAVFWILNISGRAYLSVGNAHASRYIPFGMLFALAIYFMVLKLKQSLLKPMILLIFFALLLRVQLHTEKRFAPIAERSDYYREVSSCLLHETNFDRCKGPKSYYIHSNPERVKLQEKLDYLRVRKLNIFSERDN